MCRERNKQVVLIEGTDTEVILRFFMWIIFKVFIEFITILLLFYVLVFWPQGMWDLSLLTRN